MCLRKNGTMNLRADLWVFIGIYEKPIFKQRHVSPEIGSPESGTINYRADL